MSSPTLHRLTSRRGRGFTLIELIMVLVLVGILAVTVLPRFNAQLFNDVGYRDKVIGALEFARKSAVAQRRYVQVTVVGNNLSFRIANDVPDGANATNFSAGTSRPLTLPAADRLCAAVNTNQVCAPANVTLTPPGTWTYSPLGQPSVAVATVYTVTGISPFTITIEAETGDVHSP